MKIFKLSPQETIATLIIRGWSQAEIAQEVGCSRANICRILQGAYDMRYSNLIRLWEMLNMKPPKKTVR